MCNVYGCNKLLLTLLRRMFPWISVQVKGLEPDSEYSIKVIVLLLYCKLT